MLGQRRRGWSIINPSLGGSITTETVRYIAQSQITPLRIYRHRTRRYTSESKAVRWWSASGREALSFSASSLGTRRSRKQSGDGVPLAVKHFPSRHLHWNWEGVDAGRDYPSDPQQSVIRYRPADDQMVIHQFKCGWNQTLIFPGACKIAPMLGDPKTISER